MSVSRSSLGRVQRQGPDLVIVGDPEVRPRLRGWLPLALFEVSLVVGTLLIVFARGARATTGTVIYAVSVSGLFGASALYHRGSWSPAVKRRLRPVAHAMIVVLFAGSATPMFLLEVPGLYGTLCLVALWSLAAVAAGLHLMRMH